MAATPDPIDAQIAELQRIVADLITAADRAQGVLDAMAARRMSDDDDEGNAPDG